MTQVFKFQLTNQADTNGNLRLRKIRLRLELAAASERGREIPWQRDTRDPGTGLTTS